MAYTTAPDFPIKSIEWTLDRPSQVNANAWTGTRTVVTDPWHGKWSAKVELATQQDESTFRTIRSFFARCRGSLNTFRIYATAGPQNANTGVTLSANAAAGAMSITISAAASTLLDGQFFTLNGQLCCCTADQSGSTLTFEPMLRQAATSGTVVVTSRPYALVYLSNQSFAWQIASWRQFGLTFEVAEAILEADGLVPEAGAAVLPPVNTVLPAISGTLQQGSTLTCSNGTWTNSPASYAYVWKRNGSAIGGATASTYVLISADVGTTITCTVTATNTGGSGSATSAGVGPITASPIATFTMTQLASVNRVYQRSTTSGGGQSKGQGTIAVTINVTVTGAIYARVRASDGTTVLQTPWLAGSVGGTGSQTINVSGVDARLGWFYLDLGDGLSSWQTGTVLVGMGRVVAVSGQSLAVRMFREVGDDATTLTSLGLTIDPNGVCYGTADGFPSPGTSWVLPADHSGTLNYDSAFAAEFLRLQVASSGVNCAQVGCSQGSTSITFWISGGGGVSALHTILDAVGGWEAFIWMQGHSDSLAGMSSATYQADLDTLFADLTSHNAVLGSSYGKYLASIPNIAAVGTWGLPTSINTIRNAAAAWCAINSAVYVQPADLKLLASDGVHPGQLGALALGRHFHRAMRPALGLAHGDAGPTFGTPTRAAGSANIIIPMTFPSGATAMSTVGSAKNRFFVGAPNSSQFKRPITSLTISGSQITLALTVAPPDKAPLDVWFGRPSDPAADGSADMVYDNNTDGDGISNGRHPVVSLAALAVAAPTANLGPTLANGATPAWGTAATGFGQCLTGGTGYGVSGYTTGYADDVMPFGDVWTFECRFKIAAAPASFAGFFSLGGGINTYFAVNSTGHLFFNSTAPTLTGTTNVCDNAWHHVRIVANGDSGVKMYLDGVLEASDPASYAPTVATGQFFFATIHFGSNLWPGSLDELAVWSIAKNTAGFTPPTSPYAGTETGLYALYHLNGDFTAG